MKLYKRESQQLLDTLRISDRDWRALVSDLNRQPTTYKGDERRQSIRRRFQQLAKLAIHIEHPGGGASHYLIRSRNISASGLGFLHGSYIHPNTRCQTVLKATDGELVQVHGTVVRCHLIQGIIHDIGVHFDEELQIDCFVANTRV